MRPHGDEQAHLPRDLSGQTMESWNVLGNLVSCTWVLTNCCHFTPPCLSLYSSPAECEVITVLLAGGENWLQPLWQAKAGKLFTERGTPEPGFSFYHWERKKRLKKSMLHADDCGMVIYNHAHWRNGLYLGWRVLMINNSSWYSRNIVLCNVVYFCYNIMPNKKLQFYRTN